MPNVIYKSCNILSVWYGIGSKGEMEKSEGQFLESSCDVSDDDQHAVRSSTCKKRKSKKSKYETVKYVTCTLFNDNSLHLCL